MFSTLRDQHYWNWCFSFNDLYFWSGRRSIVQLYAQIPIPCLHYQICITRNWWPPVVAALTDYVRLAPWLYHLRFSAYRVAIHWLWLAVSTLLPNYLVNTSKHCGGSIDTGGVAALTQTILPIQVANKSIMGKWRSTDLRLYKMQHTTSLTLCRHPFSDRGCVHVWIACAQNGCQYVDYG